KKKSDIEDGRDSNGEQPVNPEIRNEDNCNLLEQRSDSVDYRTTNGDQANTTPIGMAKTILTQNFVTKNPFDSLSVSGLEDSIVAN
ncbi:unnamed protein product, partial [Dovyalis caffra]